MVGVVVMGKSLAVVAVELVHALSFRSTFCGGCSESPFAEYTGNVSLRFHQAVYIIGVSRNGMLALDMPRMGVCPVCRPVMRDERDGALTDVPA